MLTNEQLRELVEGRMACTSLEKEMAAEILNLRERLTTEKEKQNRAFACLFEGERKHG